MAEEIVHEGDPFRRSENITSCVCRTGTTTLKNSFSWSRSSAKCAFCQQGSLSVASSVESTSATEIVEQTNMIRRNSDHLRDVKKLAMMSERSSLRRLYSDGSKDHLYTSPFSTANELEKERQKCLPIFHFLGSNNDKNSCEGGLKALSKIDISHPVSEGGEIIAQVMETFADDSTIIMQAMDAAQNILCANDKSVLRALTNSYRLLRFDTDFLSKVIPFVGENSVELIVDAMSRNTYHEEITKQGCIHFSKTTRLRDNIIQCEGISVIGIVLIIHMKSIEIVNLVFAALLNFCKIEYGVHNMRSLLRISELIRALKTHKTEKKIVVKGLALLFNLIEKKESSAVYNQSDLGQVREFVLESMENFPKTSTVQELGCRALFHLPFGENYERITLITLNAIPKLEHGSTSFTLLILFSTYEEFSRLFLSFDGLNAVKKKMEMSKDKIVVQEKGCAILANLLNYAESQEIQFEIVFQLVELMKHHLANSNITFSALYGLHHLAITNLEMLSLFDCGKIVLTAVSQHEEIPILQECGCALITIFLTKFQNDIDHVTGMRAIVTAMLRHHSHQSLFEGIILGLNRIFEHYGQDPVWAHEMIPVIESATSSLPDHLMHKVNEAIQITKLKENLQEQFEFEIEKPEDTQESMFFNLVIILQRSLDGIDFIDKMTQGTTTIRAKQQNEFFPLGIEYFDWYPYEEKTDFVIRINAVQSTTQVPTKLIFPREALYVMVWDTECIPKAIHEKIDGRNQVIETEKLKSGELTESIFEHLRHVHRLAPHAPIIPIAINREQASDEELIHSNDFLKLQLDEKHLSDLGIDNSRTKLNIIFDVNSEIKLRKNGDNICSLIYLRERILEIVKKEHFQRFKESDESEFRALSKEVFECVQSLKEHHFVMDIKECISRIADNIQDSTSEENILLALDSLANEGRIHHFDVVNKDVETTAVIILNPQMIMSLIESIFLHDSFEDLCLEIREIKRELDIEEEEDTNLFYKSCLKCPAITKENLIILLSDCEFNDTIINKNEIYTILMIFKELEIILPLESKWQKGIADSFFVPQHIDTEDTFYWSYKCSDMKKKSVCTSWILKGGRPQNLIKSIIQLILQSIYNMTQHAKDVDKDESRTNLDSVENQFTSVKPCEIFCWKNAILLKFAVNVLDSSGAHHQEFIETMLYYGDRDSRLCVATETMEDSERRIMLSTKGPSNYETNFMIEGGFRICDNAVEKTLSVSKDVMYKKQHVCPLCIESFSVQVAEVFDFDNQTNSEDNKPLKCSKGHSFVPFKYGKLL